MSELKELIKDYLKERGGCALTVDVARRFGISKSYASLVLHRMKKEGQLCTAVNKRIVAIWCLRDAAVEDVFSSAMPCFSRVGEAFRLMAEAGRGSAATVTPARLAKALAAICGVSMDKLTALARSYLEAALAPIAAIKGVDKYVVSLDKLKEFAQKPPKVAFNCGDVLPEPPRRWSRKRFLPVTIKLPEYVLESLDIIAREKGVTRPALLRRILAEYVQKYAAEQGRDMEQHIVQGRPEDDPPAEAGY
jgi:hypothetical protein